MNTTPTDFNPSATPQPSPLSADRAQSGTSTVIFPDPLRPEDLITVAEFAEVNASGLTLDDVICSIEAELVA